LNLKRQSNEDLTLLTCSDQWLLAVCLARVTLRHSLKKYGDTHSPRRSCTVADLFKSAQRGTHRELAIGPLFFGVCQPIIWTFLPWDITLYTSRPYKVYSVLCSERNALHLGDLFKLRYYHNVSQEPIALY